MTKPISTFREIRKKMPSVQQEVRRDIAARVASGEDIGRVVNSKVMIGARYVTDLEDRKRNLVAEILNASAKVSHSESKSRKRAA